MGAEQPYVAAFIRFCPVFAKILSISEVGIGSVGVPIDG